MIDRLVFSTGEAAGSAGSATSTGYSVHIAGEILAVAVTYNDGPPNTIDLTVYDENDPAHSPIISLSNNNTDWTYYPRTDAHGVADPYNTATYDGTYPVKVPLVVYGRLVAVIEDANAGDSATITVWYRR